MNKNYYYRITEYLNEKDNLINKSVWCDKIKNIKEARKLFKECLKYNLNLWKTEKSKERKNKTLDITISKWIIDEDGNWLDFQTLQASRFNLETLKEIK